MYVAEGEDIREECCHKEANKIHERKEVNDTTKNLQHFVAAIAILPIPKQ
jgi:hypothetical protein